MLNITFTSFVNGLIIIIFLIGKLILMRLWAFWLFRVNTLDQGGVKHFIAWFRLLF